MRSCWTTAYKNRCVSHRCPHDTTIRHPEKVVAALGPSLLGLCLNSKHAFEHDGCDFRQSIENVFRSTNRRCARYGTFYLDQRFSTFSCPTIRVPLTHFSRTACLCQFDGRVYQKKCVRYLFTYYLLKRTTHFTRNYTVRDHYENIII